LKKFFASAEAKNFFNLSANIKVKDLEKFIVRRQKSNKTQEIMATSKRKQWVGFVVLLSRFFQPTLYQNFKRIHC